MDKYEMYKVKKAIDQCNGSHSTYERRPKTWRSKHRQWDRIICTVCVGCGKPLGRYENLNRLAYCFDCRRILFPETIPSQEFNGKRSPYPRPRGHFL